MNNNDLELDFSNVDGNKDNNQGDNSGLEIDYSGVEGNETSENQNPKEESTEDSATETKEHSGSNASADEASENDPNENDKNENESNENGTNKNEANESDTDESKETSPDGDEQSQSNDNDENQEKETLDEIDSLLSELDDSAEKSSEGIDKAEELIKDGLDSGEEQTAQSILEGLKLDNAQYKTTVDQLNKLVKKLNREKGDVVMRNTELELYGNVDDPSLIYLNGNIDKAKGGDEKSKRRIISILDDMRTELAGSTLEEDNINDKADMMSKISGVHSSSNPNLTSGGGIDDYQINL